jgi:hypothetical protein
MKANLAQRPSARQVHHLSTLASPPLLQRQVPKKTILLLKPKRRRTRKQQLSCYTGLPQAAAARLQIPFKAKLIGGKQICFLGLMSGSHERKFLKEAGSSFAIPHKEEYFGDFNSVDLITTCGDLALKGFVASQCLARKLEREDKEVKDSSAAVVASLQTRMAKLEKILVIEQDQSQ